MIPRRLHSVWVGDPMPDHLAEYISSWVRVHAGWQHRIWHESDLQWLQNQELFDFAEAITGSHGQFRSDVARYEILHRYGGVYIDADFEAVNPIDELLIGVDCFAAWETDDVWVGNAILGSVPGHPFLKDLIDGLPANVKRHKGKRPNFLSGPRYVTEVIGRHPDVTVFPSSMMYPYSYADVGTERAVGPFPGAWAIHHWENTRSGRRVNRPARA